MIFLMLLRRLSARARLITGVVVTVAGLAAVAVSAVVTGLLFHAIALIVIGAAMCASAVVSQRRAQRAAYPPPVDDELTRAGSAHVR